MILKIVCRESDLYLETRNARGEFRDVHLERAGRDNVVTQRPSDHLINELRDPRGGLGAASQPRSRSRRTHSVTIAP